MSTQSNSTHSGAPNPPQWFSNPTVIRVIIGVVFAIGSYIFYQQYQATEKEHALIKGQLIDQTLSKRVTKYRRERLAKCQDKAIREAVIFTDSLLMARAGKVAADTVARPDRPEKPLRPDLDLPVDTTPLIPLLPRDSLKETQDSISL